MHSAPADTSGRGSIIGLAEDEVNIISSDLQSFTLAQLRFWNQHFHTNQNIHFRTSLHIKSDVKNSHEFALRIKLVREQIGILSLLKCWCSAPTIDQDLNTHHRIC